MTSKSLFKRIMIIPHIKDILINTSGNYLNVFFTAMYSIILVRVFEPAEFGVFSVLLSISYILANVLDFGVAATIYSYLPPLLTDKQEMHRFLKTNFSFQIILALFSLFIVSWFIVPIDKYILKLHAPIYLYLIALSSVPLYIGQNFCINSLIAAKKILKINLATNLTNLIKLTLLVIIIQMNKIDLVTALFLVGIISPLIFFTLIFKEFNKVIIKVVQAKIQKNSLKKSYTATFFLSTQVFNFATRIDLFVITYYLAKTDVGYYGLAQKIILSILTSVTSITQIFSPEFANTKSPEKIKVLVRKVLLFMMIPVGIFIAAVITPNTIYSFVFTAKYSSVAPITKALSVAHIFYALGAGVGLFVLYTIRKPVHILIANLFLLIIISSGSIIFVPVFGYLGPSYAIFVAYFVAFVYLSYIYNREVKKLK